MALLQISEPGAVLTLARRNAEQREIVVVETHRQVSQGERDSKKARLAGRASVQRRPAAFRRGRTRRTRSDPSRAGYGT